MRRKRLKKGIYFRKGIYFSIDALVAIIIIIIAITTLNSYYSEKKEVTQITYSSSDTVETLSTLKINDVKDPDIQYIISNLNESFVNKTVFEIIGRLWVTGRKQDAIALASNLTEKIIPDNFGFSITIGNTEIFSRNNQTPVNQLVTAKQLISGIEEGKAVEGFSTKVFLTGINQKTSSSFVYFGGYIGDGNITQAIKLPSSFNKINSMYIELNAGSGFDLYINNVYSGTYNVSGPGNDTTADKFYVNASYFSNMHGNLNNVSFNFKQNSLSYIGGGYIKISYDTSEVDLVFNTTVVSEKDYLPGVAGIINEFSSFYVPGSLMALHIYLHYFKNQTFEKPFLLRIGNVSVFSDQVATGELFVNLNTSYLSSLLNYTAISEKTVPYRLGFINLTTITYAIAGYRGDSLLTTDVSGSMGWRMDSNTATGSVTINNCSSPQLEAGSTKRISVAKCLDKEFTERMLNISGNKVGLVSYSSSLENFVNLTQDNNTLVNEINSYTPSGATCISCGVYKGVESLIKVREPNALIPIFSNWTYNAQFNVLEPGIDEAGNNWVALSYNDTNWSVAYAPFGSGYNDTASPFESIADLWDMAADKATAEVDFTSGLNFTANTFGPSNGANNDGWDWGNGTYGGNGSSTRFNNDSSLVAVNKKLNISIGYNYGNNAKPDSGSYGIEFYITPSMHQGMVNATLSFDWQFDDIGLDISEDVWIKARFGNITSMKYLGSNLDGGTDNTTEIMYDNNPNSQSGSYKIDVAKNITGAGWYYMDIGGKVRTWSSSGENGIFLLDNVKLAIIKNVSNTYYRKKFYIANATNLSSVRLAVNSDNRSEVYINGNLVSNDTHSHYAAYWNTYTIVNNSYFTNGNNIMAVKVINNDNLARFDLSLHDDRRKALIVMSDGDANYCNGPRDYWLDNNTNQGSCSSSIAINETITFACRAHQYYGMEIFAVAFGNVSTTGKDTLNKTACCDDCSKFYTSNNASGLKEIYKNIAERLYQINITQLAQTYNVSGGNFTNPVLYPDSYIEFNYTPSYQFTAASVPLTIETSDFGNNLTNGSFFVPDGVTVRSAAATSYSGNRWTRDLFIMNNNYLSWTNVYNLSKYDTNYQELGDPYIIQIPTSYITINDNNEILVQTGINSSDINGGSPDNRVIYTILANVFVNITTVSSKANGCNWFIEFEDGSNITIKVPSDFTGSKVCYYKNSSYDSQDSMDIAAYNLFSKLDLNGDGKLLFKIDSSDVSVSTESIKGIPYMWGPTIMEVRVWQ